MKSATKHILIEVARYLLALTFLFSGVVKAIDPVGASIKVGEYFTSFQMPFMTSFAMPVAIALSTIEFMLGALLLMGVWRKLTAWGTVLLMGFMTLLTLYLALYNPVADCGCFGDAFKLTNWQTFEKNIVLFSAALVFLFGSKHISGAFTYKAVWIPVLSALLGILVFTFANYRHLPMLDFRPYKVGENLRSLVLVPEDAPQDEYSYEFIYEKDGVQKTFGMDNLPDSSWSYVDRHDKLISKGYTPPITDFILFSGTEDVTKDVLAGEGELVFITTPNWEKVPRSLGQELNLLQEAVEERSAALYALSSSTLEEEKDWRESTGASYECLFLDATTIKTMARGVPSIIFIKDGVIYRKMNGHDLPNTREEMGALLENTYTQGVRHEGYLLRSLLLIIWFLYTLVSLIITSTRREITKSRTLPIPPSA